MTLSRNQLRSDPFLEGYARLSSVTWAWTGPLFLAGAVAFGAAFAISASNGSQYVVPLVVAGCIAGLLVRWRREVRLVRTRSIAVATITHRSRESDGEGVSFTVKYRFIASDGYEYLGKGSSSNEFPREGEYLPIMYCAERPENNIPLASFLFYKFSYDGTR